MSGLAAIYQPDGGRPSLELVSQMLASIPHRGPDGSGLWADDYFAAGQNIRHTTPESLREVLPLVSPRDGLTLILDGRIDNRQDLLRDLRSQGANPTDDTDAGLFLEAYRCWNTSCLGKIIGDFAVIIWDAPRRALFCARDIFGIRPFYYRYQDGRYVFASEPQQFFADPAFTPIPNESMIAEFLTANPRNWEETLYKDICRLPPAHFLRIEGDRVRKERYWSIDPKREIRYASDREYAEHFFSIFRETVLTRTRSIGTLGADLSGGLDSSSIVAMVETLRSEGAAPAAFETFSMTFPGKDCDETKFIQDAKDHIGLINHMVTPQPPYTGYRDEVRRHRNLPRFPNTAMQDGIRKLAAARGVRVMLNGMGGDEWLTGSFYHLADQIAGFRWLEVLRALRQDLRIPGIMYPAQPLLRLGLWPLLPVPVRRVVSRIRHGDGCPPWIGDKFRSRTGLPKRVRRAASSVRFATIAQEEIWQDAVSPHGVALREIEDPTPHLLGLEYRHPLHDRRIAEFAMAVPEEQRWRGGITKFVLREAMRGLLPESIRTRDSKADFSHVFAETLLALGVRESLGSLSIAKEGWVDPTVIRGVCDRIIERYGRGNELFRQGIWEVWAVWSVEQWWADLRQGPHQIRPNK